MDKKLAELQKNPLIEGRDTVNNCCSVVAFVQEALSIGNIIDPDGGHGLSKSAVTGLYFTLQCVRHALEHEREYQV